MWRQLDTIGTPPFPDADRVFLSPPFLLIPSFKPHSPRLFIFSVEWLPVALPRLQGAWRAGLDIRVKIK